MSERIYVMEFIRLQQDATSEIDGRRMAPAAHGYEACEDPAPIPLVASTVETARMEADLHWLSRRSNLIDEKLKGYWIVTPDSQMVHLHVEPNAI